MGSVTLANKQISKLARVTDPMFPNKQISKLARVTDPMFPQDTRNHHFYPLFTVSCTSFFSAGSNLPKSLVTVQHARTGGQRCSFP